MRKWQQAVIVVESEDEWELLFEEIFFLPAVARILANLGKKGIKQVYLVTPRNVENLSFHHNTISKAAREIEYFPSWSMVPEIPPLKEPFLLLSPNYLWHPEIIEWFTEAIGSQNLAQALLKGNPKPLMASVTIQFVAAKSGVQDLAFPLKLEIPENIPCLPLLELKKNPKSLIPFVGKSTDRPHVITVRHLLFPFLTFCARKRIHPDKITWLGFFVHLAGCLLLITPGYLSGVAAALTLIFSWILDCADGTLARLTHRESLAGQILDTRLGHLSNLIFFLALLIRTYPPKSLQNIALAVLLIGGIITTGYLHGMVEKMPASQKKPMRRFFLKINHRDYAFVVLAFALLNALPLFVWLALIGTYCYALAELSLLMMHRP